MWLYFQKLIFEPYPKPKKARGRDQKEQKKAPNGAKFNFQNKG